MNAFRPWETLFVVLFTSTAWTRGVFSSIPTTACPGGVTCPGFLDEPDYRFCCPSSRLPATYYCCNENEMRRSDKDHSKHIPEIVGGVVGSVFFCATAVVLACCFCSCCYVYKRRHSKKRNAEETVPRRPQTTTLASRYRNWPRHFPPSSASNGNCVTATSRYYRRQQDEGALGAYRPYNQYQRSVYGRPLACRDDSDLSTCCNDRVDDCLYERNFYGASTYVCPYDASSFRPIQDDVKPFEAPPPYPVAHYYPTFPPVTSNDGTIDPSLTTSITNNDSGEVSRTRNNVLSNGTHDTRSKQQNDIA